MNWADRLDEATTRVGNPCLLGIDPHLDLLPEEFALARDESAPRAARARAVARFACELIDLAADRIACVKPQAAFFELLGADGWSAWEEVVAHAHARGLLVIGDVKRGDISSTAAAYARALFEAPGTSGAVGCDALTLNPYLGGDSITPFLEACAEADKGLYILVRTSNPSSAEFQLAGDPPLWSRVAAAVEAWGAELRGACGLSAVGAVVGATHASELSDLRAALPHAPLLLPGYGAQGASAADLSPAFANHAASDAAHPWRGALVNSSRGIAFAYRRPEHAGKPWQAAASAALDAMIADLSVLTPSP